MNTRRHPRRLFAGLSWVMAANIVAFASSALLTLILPRFITPAEFGFWQLYQLFALYLGYVTFGYSDGLNLRLAGRRFTALPKKQLSSGLFYLTVLDALFFFSMVGIFALLSPGDSALLFAWAAIGSVFYIPRTAMSIIFQSAGMAKAYSVTMVTERVVLVVGVLLMLTAGEASATTLVIADVFSKAVGVVVALWIGRSVFVGWPSARRSVVRFFLRDCRDGSYVLFANVAAMLIQGGVRGIVIGAWDVVVFGQISLAFQFASLFMVAVNSVAVSVLPNLKRLDRAEYVAAYLSLRRRMVTPLIACLLLCLPITVVLDWWLPDYTVAVYYMALLFPLFIYESLNRGLTAVFMKAMRVERALLLINCIALAVALGIALFGAFVLHNLDVTVLAIVVALAVRALMSELLVARSLGFSVKIEWLAETGIVVLFLLTFLLGRPWWAVLSLIGVVAGYVIMQSVMSMRRRAVVAGEKEGL